MSATVETDSTRSADDAAIWIHPSDTAYSLIIGTDKGSNGGLRVYDLSGNELQFVADGRMNNVDLRYNVLVGGQAVDLVTAGNRSNDSIAIFQVNATTRELENVAAGTLETGIGVYGSCMYRSPQTDKTYVFVNSKQGEVEQWELFDTGSGQVDGSLVRSFDVDSQTEGCVADDELGYLYIGEENIGIWKYGAEPDGGNVRTQVDNTGSGGYLTADVEGLPIYYGSNGTGYLIASSQGSSEYVVYTREGAYAYVTTFKIVEGNGIDGVTRTDGIDVTNFPLGAAYPYGVFVAHDDSNEQRENYKLVPWDVIATWANPDLMIDTGVDPRQLGAAGGNGGPQCPPGAPDTDSDGIVDVCDNCIEAANGPTIPDAGGNSQRDTDGDNFGNVCDPDFNGNLTVDTQDLSIIKNALLSTSNPDQRL